VPTGASLSRKIAREILPKLEAAEFAHAEQLLVQWIQELPESPLHVAVAPETVITTPAAEAADFIDSFLRTWTLPGAPKVLYAEVNAFTVNTDEWFFDLFGFARAGSREDYDWLGDFDTFTERRQVIRGMETLQAAYGQGGIKVDDDTRTLVDLLVIVRFQHLLQRALAHVKPGIRLLACAHDYSSYIAEIRASSPE
jgi:hypothetical protein